MSYGAVYFEQLSNATVHAVSGHWSSQTWMESTHIPPGYIEPNRRISSAFPGAAGGHGSVESHATTSRTNAAPTTHRIPESIARTSARIQRDADPLEALWD